MRRFLTDSILARVLLFIPLWLWQSLLIALASAAPLVALLVVLGWRPEPGQALSGYLSLVAFFAGAVLGASIGYFLQQAEHEEELTALRRELERRTRDETI